MFVRVCFIHGNTFSSLLFFGEILSKIENFTGAGSFYHKEHCGFTKGTRIANFLFLVMVCMQNSDGRLLERIAEIDAAIKFGSRPGCKIFWRNSIYRHKVQHHELRIAGIKNIVVAKKNIHTHMCGQRFAKCFAETRFHINQVIGIGKHAIVERDWHFIGKQVSEVQIKAIGCFNINPCIQDILRQAAYPKIGIIPRKRRIVIITFQVRVSAAVICVR